MDPDRMKAAARDAKDQVEDQFDRVGDNARQRVRGLADQATGAAERLMGSAPDAARSVAHDYDLDNYARAGRRLARRAASQPIEGLLIAAALGYLVGWFLHARD